MSQKHIEEKLQESEERSKDKKFFDLLNILHEKERITYEQYILVGNYCLADEKADVEMLAYMGLPKF